MSNGNGGNNCGKFVRQGERIYVYDTKDEERAKADPGLKIGPIAVYSLSEYRDRVVAVQLTGNARYMFDRPEQHESLSDDEMQSIATHAGSGALNLRHFQHDGAEVTARQ
ncbi:MAG TPA: hypothetical protein VD735_00635, partial [Candidatus Saccharimonadales bacterium]|nr:hypothetical protein [Candidatus Saccharimonadales bacterium]